MNNPKFREVKTLIKGHTASKCWLLDLNLDLAHPKDPRPKLPVQSLYLYVTQCFLTFGVCNNPPGLFVKDYNSYVQLLGLIQQVQSGTQVPVCAFF